jgi:hypothetical protein
VWHGDRVERDRGRPVVRGKQRQGRWVGTGLPG